MLSKSTLSEASGLDDAGFGVIGTAVIVRPLSLREAEAPVSRPDGFPPGLRARGIARSARTLAVMTSGTGKAAAVAAVAA